MLWRRAGAKAIGEGRGTAVVHERRAPSDADERRYLERASGADVHSEVVGELRPRVTRCATGGRALEERLPAAADAVSTQEGGGGAATFCTQPLMAPICSVVKDAPFIRTVYTSFTSTFRFGSSPGQW